MTLRDTYPKLFRITATLRAPEGKTADDVRKVIRQRLPALTVVSVEDVSGEEKQEDNS